jgi:hypothetical protein
MGVNLIGSQDSVTLQAWLNDFIVIQPTEIVVNCLRVNASNDITSISPQ